MGKKVYYRKLVRDKIPDKIRAKGSTLKIKILSKLEYERELLLKVVEEAAGLPASKNRAEIIEELADVTEVIEAIRKLKKISVGELQKARDAKNKLRGAFKKKIFLVWSADDTYKTNEPLGKQRKYG